MSVQYSASLVLLTQPVVINISNTKVDFCSNFFSLLLLLTSLVLYLSSDIGTTLVEGIISVINCQVFSCVFIKKTIVLPFASL
jgi:hypothetical protein